MEAFRFALAKPYGVSDALQIHFPCRPSIRPLFSLWNNSWAPCKAQINVTACQRSCCKTRSTFRRCSYLAERWEPQRGDGGEVLAGTWTAGCDRCQENDVRTAAGVMTGPHQVLHTFTNQDCQLTLPLTGLWAACPLELHCSGFNLRQHARYRQKVGDKRTQNDFDFDQKLIGNGQITLGAVLWCKPASYPRVQPY